MPILKTINNYLFATRSADEDIRRREFILLVLLLASVILAGTATVISALDHLKGESTSHGVSIYFLVGIFGFFLALFEYSRRRFSLAICYFMICLYFALATFAAVRYSIHFSQAWLLYVLVIIISAILISTRFSLRMLALIAVTTGYIAYREATGTITPRIHWIYEPLGDDLIAIMLILGIITLVSWLSNREIERSLARARQSELALKKERDQLEEKVIERTRELEMAQLEKMVQVYRFAAFGRMASGFFHDLVNPLTAVSLSLEGLKDGKSSPDLVTAIEGTQRMQRFIEAARRQIQHQEHRQLFSVGEEIKQAVNILSYKARKSGVTVTIDVEKDAETYGNPIKFQQLITNLVSNAVDAYEGSKLPRDKKTIVITINERRNKIEVSIHDHGYGIPAKNHDRVFEPFFTTKSIDKGTGIGLSITRDLIEKDFDGSINFTSNPNEGTRFIVQFPKKKS